MITKNDALDILFDNTPIEIILDSYDAPDFYEFVGECGGDVMRYRIYKKDGSIYEK